MQLRGLACWSGSDSGLPGSSGIGRLEPVGAVVAVEGDDRALSGIVASRWRAISRWASDWLSLTCSASAKRTWEVRNVSSASRAPARSSRCWRSRRRVRTASSPPTTANRPLTSSVSQTATRAAAPSSSSRLTSRRFW